MDFVTTATTAAEVSAKFVAGRPYSVQLPFGAVVWRGRCSTDGSYGVSGLLLPAPAGAAHVPAVAMIACAYELWRTFELATSFTTVVDMLADAEATARMVAPLIRAEPDLSGATVLFGRRDYEDALRRCARTGGI